MIIPNPGNPEAIEAGCLCPIWDNHRGQGIPGEHGDRLFWQNEICPLHGRESKPNDNH